MYNNHDRMGRVSVREGVIHDEESTEILLHMVESARNVIITHNNHTAFRRVISELVHDTVEDDEGVMTSFFCGMDDVDERAMKKKQLLVDKWIDQLLRFLAMKILLSDSVNDCGRDTNGMEILRLNPSTPVRAAWKSLLMLPHLYTDVCRVLGVPPIDYEEEEQEFLGEKSTSAWGRRSYLWTMETYSHIYTVHPTHHFWPKLDRSDDSLFKSIFQTVAPHTKIQGEFTV